MIPIELTHFQLDLQNYTYDADRLIGEGGYSKVYKVVEKKTRKIYAAKIIEGSKEYLDQTIKREIQIMLSLHNPTIAKIIGYAKTNFDYEEDSLTMIMPFYEKSSLDSIITKLIKKKAPKEITKTSLQIILIGIARGMKYLHDHSIIHRDLKPRNVLLDEKYHPLIADFGLSKFYNNLNPVQSINLGTCTYRSPEVIIKSQNYGEGSDVYSFAILMLEVVSCKKLPPFSDNDVIEGYRPPIPEDLKPSLKDLIEQCWSKMPEDRPSFTEIYRKLISDEYFLDDVDANEIRKYIKEINPVNDHIDQMSNEIEDLIDENKRLTDQIAILMKIVKNDPGDEDCLSDEEIPDLSKISNLADDIRQLLRTKDKLAAENNKIKAERDNLTNENNKIKAERDNLTNENNQIKAERDDLANENNKIKAERDNLTNENNQIKAERDNLANENNKIKAERDNLTNENNKIKSEKDNLTNENNQIKAERDNLTNENNKIKSEKDNLTNENNKIKAERDNLTNENNQIKAERDNLTNENNKIKAERENLTNENNQIKAERDNLANENNKIKAERDNLANENNKIKAERDNLTNENNQIKAERDNLTNENNKIKAERENLTNENNQIKAERDNLANENNQIKAERDNLTNENNQIKAERDNLTNENNKIKAERENLTNENNQIKAERDNLANENNQIKAERDNLTNENNKIKAERDNLTNENNKIKAERENLTNENNQIKAERDNLANENNQIKAERDNLANENNQIKAERDNLANENNQIKAERDNLTNENNQIKAERDNLANENNKIKAERENLTNENNQIKAERDNLTIENNKIKAERENLANENNKIKAERDNLANENNKIKAERDNLTNENNKIKAVRENLTNENNKIKAEAEPEENLAKEKEQAKYEVKIEQTKPTEDKAKSEAESDADAEEEETFEFEELEINNNDIKLTGSERLSQQQSNINVIFIGHVNSGKSTTAGHLLYSSCSIDQETIEKVKERVFSSKRGSRKYAFIFDQLDKERETGHTFDISNKKLLRSKRLFSIIDSPGHQDRILNMIKGTSQSDAAVVVVSSLEREFENDISKIGQTREMLTLAQTFGIKRIIIAVNKMDSRKVSYSKHRFDEIENKMIELMKEVGYKKNQYKIIPISGLRGDNLIHKSSNLSWWLGGTLLENLDQLEIPTRPSNGSLRVPVQSVYREIGRSSLPCGRICSGTLKRDSKIIFVPGNKVVKVSKIKMYREEYSEGFPGNNVVIEPDRSIEVLPGQVCGEMERDPPRICEQFTCEMTILNNYEDKIRSGKQQYTLCCHTSHVKCEITKITKKTDQNHRVTDNPKTIKKGDKAIVDIKPVEPIVVERYDEYPELGCFCIRHRKQTIAFGVIRNVEKKNPPENKRLEEKKEIYEHQQNENEFKLEEAEEIPVAIIKDEQKSTINLKHDEQNENQEIKDESTTSNNEHETETVNLTVEQSNIQTGIDKLNKECHEPKELIDSSIIESNRLIEGINKIKEKEQPKHEDKIEITEKSKSEPEEKMAKEKEQAKYEVNINQSKSPRSPRSSQNTKTKEKVEQESNQKPKYQYHNQRGSVNAEYAEEEEEQDYWKEDEINPPIASAQFKIKGRKNRVYNDSKEVLYDLNYVDKSETRKRKNKSKSKNTNMTNPTIDPSKEMKEKEQAKHEDKIEIREKSKYEEKIEIREKSKYEVKIEQTKPTEDKAKSEAESDADAEEEETFEFEELEINNNDIKLTGSERLSQQQSNINVIFIGHVNSGKSTTAGHLLYSSCSIDQETIEKVKERVFSSKRGSRKYAFIFDQLDKERETGHTFDISNKKLLRSKRLFSIIDSPGHQDRILNMIKGTSQSDAAVVVVSSLEREFENDISKIGQTREMLTLAQTFGIKRIIIAVNKMDSRKVSYSKHRFDEIENKMIELMKEVGYKKNQYKIIPISGLRGDNLIHKSSNLSWWLGGTLLENLDQLEIPTRPSNGSLRVPVQSVYREIGRSSLPCGRICSGTLKRDSKIIFVPGNKVVKVSKIKMYREEYSEGFPGNNVVIEPDRSIEVLPGQVCGEMERDPPRICEQFTCEMTILNNYEDKI